MVQISRTRNYLAGLATGYTVTMVTMVVGLWLTPFTLRFLDREQYAIFTLTYDFLNWLYLVDLGTSASLSVQAAHMTGEPQQERLNRLASTAFFAQLALTGLAVLLGIILVFVFPSFFPVRTDLQPEARQVVALTLAGILIGLGTRPFSVLLVAHQQIHIDNLIRLGLIGLRTALTVILLLTGWGLLSLALANLVATAVTSILAVIRTYRLLPQLKITYKLVSWQMLRETTSLGIWFSLGGLAGLVIASLDRMVIAKLFAVEMVTTLSLTGRLYELSTGVLSKVTDTARPMLGQLLGQGKKNEALTAYRQMFGLSTGLAVIVSATLWAGNGTFVQWWVGSANYGGPLMDLALALNLIIHLWVLPNRATLSAGLIVKPQTLSRLVEGALNLGFSITLAYYWGPVGIIFGTTIAGLLTSNWYLPRLTAQMFQRPFINFLWADAGRVLLLMVCLAPVAFWAREQAFNLGGLRGTIQGMTLTGTMGAILMWFFVFDQMLRSKITTVVIKIIKLRSEKIDPAL